MHPVNPLRLVALDDKYLLSNAPVFITGIQALVRLPLLRRELDAALGLTTAGFISGYRGSPLGGYDKQLAGAAALLAARDIVARPAINEDLAVTAVWGSQQVNLYPGVRHDGVFGIWYGKGPGVDRSGDALKHANFAGTSRHGGVLALAGDDHACKSSTLPNQSDFAFIDAEMPVLAPSDIADLLEFGAKGIALSRHAGLWVGMKTIADLMDSTATVTIDPARYATQAPSDLLLPVGGLNIRAGDTPQAQEERHRHFRLPAAQAFARANGFDRVVLGGAHARIGVIASGKAYLHVRQALRDLGFDDSRAAAFGLRLYKVGLAWPLDPVGVPAFAADLEQVIVVEERRDVIEHQVKALLYDLPDARRPRVVGKQDEHGRPLLRDLLDLDTAKVAQALYRQFPDSWRDEAMRRRIAELAEPAKAAETVTPLHTRGPFFCSGCPHNTSTNLPEGARATAGIGCHFLVQWMDRNSDSCTHMGGEGIPWMGQAPFTTEAHIFANLGDGTYHHSGALAIRQAVAARLNITYKILYNDAVAMTGGQQVDGPLTVPALIAQLAAEGVTRIAVVSDDPTRHGSDPLIPRWVSFDGRERLDAVQQELRRHPGVSVLVYDQTCATELRRRRKRGEAPAAARRLFINPEVCEGCGDCSRASNCISVEPLEIEFGRKRRINQSSCNQDATCVDGFCPSFVSVRGGGLHRVAPRAAASLPMPELPAIGADGYNILAAGIGGQGVTALAAILGMAAHLQGLEARLVDQLGMAQKGGGVYAHIRLGQPGTLFGPRIGAAQADLLLAADLVVAHGKAALPACGNGRTVAIVDAAVAPTAEFVRDNQLRYDGKGMLAALAGQCREVVEVDAANAVTAQLGDAIHANIFLLGHAWQRGLVPLDLAAIERAIELNGAAVAANRRAFELGRQAAATPATPVALPETLDAVLARRTADLTAYQDTAYAARYRAVVDRVRAAERVVAPGSDALAMAVARGLHKLMAYKDEYEVARLYTDGRFAAALRAQFDGSVQLELHLAPPLLARRDPRTGRPLKRRFGPWMLPAMRGLARLKGLRGTRFDPFGRTAERVQERALIAEYQARLERILSRLDGRNHAVAVAYAAVADTIRGYGHVKQASIETARQRWAELEARIANPPVLAQAAE